MPAAHPVARARPSEPSDAAESFVAPFARVLVLALALLVATNVWVDPRGMFGVGHFPVLVATARTEKLALLAAAPVPPRALILGSSAMMRFDPRVVERHTGLPTFNLAVNSGKPEDFLALLRHVVDGRKLSPDLVIVGVDPRTFTPLANEGFDERLLASDELTRRLEVGPWQRAWWRARLVLGTLDWTYEANVIRSIALAALPARRSTERYRFRADGFLAREGAYNPPGWRPSFVFPEVDEPSRERRRLFRAFLEEAHAQGARVVIVITPYAPGYVAHLETLEAGRHAREIELLATLVRDLAPEARVEVFDFSTPEAFGGADEFIGTMHPSTRNCDLMLGRALALSP